MSQPSIKTTFTETMGIKYPIIAAPMFLVSNEAMVVAVSEYGGLGTVPSLNYRPPEAFASAIKKIKSKTNKPIGVNLIVNKSNTRFPTDLKASLNHGVDCFITSLGNPKTTIKDAHKNGAKVFCDVTNLEHALKVQDLGADAVIAVCSGAGGHAGPISPFALIPWLSKELDIPVIAAGGIADGTTMAASLALGAQAVSVGTRFIACHEAGVTDDYKQAVIDASPEDIVMTEKVSGTPAAVINTDFVKKQGLKLNWAVKTLKNNSYTKKFVVPLIHLAGMKSLEKAATKMSWKSVWSAGQSVGLVEKKLSCDEIMEKMINEYYQCMERLPS